MKANHPVVAIPISFNKEGKIDLNQVVDYLDYLTKNNVQTVMTTAGTSDYHLLSKSEIRSFNFEIINCFKGNIICGLPALSLNELEEEISKYNDYCLEPNRCSLMILHPDRYYGDTPIIQHFNECADISSLPIYIHAMFMRHGKAGGLYNYTAELTNELLKHENIIGLKEESTSFEIAYDFCRKLDRKADIIVAGKSMRRWQLLRNVGANRFLSGIGNLYPHLEQKFVQSIISGDQKKQFELLNIENKVFDAFFKVGWHPSLKFSLKHLKLCCAHQTRLPSYSLTSDEQGAIIHILDYLKQEANKHA